MKYVPATPPSPRPGVVAQGGLAGPFLRAGNMPVQPRRPAAVAARSFFSYGSKNYRYASAPVRAGWDARAPAGVSGSAPAAGSNAANAPATAQTLAASPGPYAVGDLVIHSVSFTAAAGLLLDVEVSGIAADRLAFAFSQPWGVYSSEATARVTVGTRAYSGRDVFDLTAEFVARWGVPRDTNLVGVLVRAFVGQNFGTQGETSVQYLVA